MFLQGSADEAEALVGGLFPNGFTLSHCETRGRQARAVSVLPHEARRDRGSSFCLSHLVQGFILRHKMAAGTSAIVPHSVSSKESGREKWHPLKGLSWKSSDCSHLNGQTLVVRS